MYKDDDAITLLVCTETLKVGCVLIQASAGFPSGIISELFNPETWILVPKPTLSPLKLSYKQWRKFADKINQGQESRDTLLQAMKKE